MRAAEHPDDSGSRRRERRRLTLTAALVATSSVWILGQMARWFTDTVLDRRLPLPLDYWLERSSWTAAAAGLALTAAMLVLSLRDRKRQSVEPSAAVAVAHASTVIAAPMSRQSRFYMIPPRNPAFIGRHQEVSELRRFLTGGQSAVALCGPVGAGKTEIAAEYVYRYACEYDLIWWIPASGNLADFHLAEIATNLGLADPDVHTAVATRRAIEHLASSGRWLLILDGAEEDDRLFHQLPSSTGHTVITSRSQGWHDVAVPLPVPDLAIGDRIDLVRKFLPTASDVQVRRLAAAAGGGPLAIVTAARLAATSGTVDLLIDKIEGSAAVWRESGSIRYRSTASASVGLAVDRLNDESPGAATLLKHGAMLSSDWIPLSLFSAGPREILPMSLKDLAKTPLSLAVAARDVSETGLARVANSSFKIPDEARLIVRGALSDDEQRRVRATVEVLLIARTPADPRNPQDWDTWRNLVPHILGLDPAHSKNAEFRRVAYNTVWYYLFRGDAKRGLALAERLWTQWLADYGSENSDALEIASTLQRARRDLGHYVAAYLIGRSAYRQQLRMFGVKDRNTQAFANNHGIDLRSIDRPDLALRLDRLTNERNTRYWGEDDPDTLRTSGNLAADYGKLGRPHDARHLNERTLARMQAALGEDHLHTLRVTSNLATNLRHLGEISGARSLDEFSLYSHRARFGTNHPVSLRAANNLSADLYAATDYRAAVALDEDTLVRQSASLGGQHPQTRRTARSLISGLRLIDRGQDAARIERKYFGRPQ